MKISVPQVSIDPSSSYYHCYHTTGGLLRAVRAHHVGVLSGRCAALRHEDIRSCRRGGDADGNSNGGVPGILARGLHGTVLPRLSLQRALQLVANTLDCCEQHIYTSTVTHLCTHNYSHVSSFRHYSSFSLLLFRVILSLVIALYYC